MLNFNVEKCSLFDPYMGVLFVAEVPVNYFKDNSKVSTKDETLNINTRILYQYV